MSEAPHMLEKCNKSLAEWLIVEKQRRIEAQDKDNDLTRQCASLREKLAVVVKAAERAGLCSCQWETRYGTCTDCLGTGWTRRDPNELEDEVERLTRQCAGLRENLSDAEEEVDELRLRLNSLMEALTPSAATKAAYIGEFSFATHEFYDENGDMVVQGVTVPWATIKDIMKVIVNRARGPE